METQTQSISIAAEVLNQIKYIDKWALGAYAAKHFIALPESKEFQGGVKFSVDGKKHSGYVIIALRWVDDYTVSFLSKKGELVHKVEGVYYDMLVSVIDYVEGK